MTWKTSSQMPLTALITPEKDDRNFERIKAIASLSALIYGNSTLILRCQFLNSRQRILIIILFTCFNKNVCCCLKIFDRIWYFC
ncbi:MAG: hypothetical protein WBA41_09870 [Rivularia sp. (in: cyanobacteria)]